MLELPPLTDREILAARGPHAAEDATRPYAWFAEPERTAEGRVEDVAAVFVTNRECPFRCLVCDLWKHTTRQRAPAAAVAAQLEWALERLPRAPHVKLYNSGSFFDAQAIPHSEWPRIAELVRGRKTLIVECHPRLVDARCAEFAALIAPVKLQVAMGLETVDPVVLPRLKESMTLEDFERAAHFLVECGVDVRAFVLLGPPGHRGAKAVSWAQRSVEYALSHGVECCAVIPVRSGNGIVEELERRGVYARPTLSQLHAVLVHGLELTARARGGRVFADLWDIERFYDCARCGDARAAALRRMNLSQQPAALVDCRCSESA
jgi:radical SAM enzyme (TIGR01210 family)